MSGHSHFKTIKYRKETTDKKRGQIFSKLSRAISIAAKEKGGDPLVNPVLRLAIEKAKGYNMPKDNIERAVKKGTGELAGESLETVVFEFFAPGGAAVIVEGITDNKNRALGEIKQILNKYNAKLANEGAVKWMFEQKGCIVVEREEQNKNFTSRENLEIAAIEAGAQDFQSQNSEFYIYTIPENLNQTRNNLEEQGIKIESVYLEWITKEEVEPDSKNKELYEHLFESLDELDSVQEIYSNLKS